MTEEDEAFNDIERRSKVKQDILMHPSKEAMLTAEVAVLTEMVRAQAKRVAELEQRTWVGLTDEDKASCVQATAKRGSTYELIAAIEAKLKEKNT